jgi:hypothetical protein
VLPRELVIVDIVGGAGASAADDAASKLCRNVLRPRREQELGSAREAQRWRLFAVVQACRSFECGAGVALAVDLAARDAQEGLAHVQAQERGRFIRRQGGCVQHDKRNSVRCMLLGARAAHAEGHSTQGTPL